MNKETNTIISNLEGCSDMFDYCLTPKARLVLNIKELQQENKHLDEVNCKLRKTNKQLKDNWNELKEYIRKNIIYDDVGMKILDPSPLEDYMQEIEQGSDSK